MKYSKLKHEIELLELKQSHEMQLLKMQQEQEMRLLKQTCTHTYEDGSTAKNMQGTQWDMYYKCSICNVNMK